MFEKIIDHYDDYKECGDWSTVDATGNTIRTGKMITRTVKVINNDKSVGLSYEWITDEDMRSEMGNI